LFQDELERELEELEQEQLDQELLGVGPSVDELPSVPTTELAKPLPTKAKASGYQVSSTIIFFILKMAVNFSSAS
jgi:charged multivesicular body protein 4